MQLEAARAELRLRSPAEAMDLGLLLLRALRGPALRAWLLVVLPLQLAVLAVLAPFDSGWSLLALVWLAPLFDRVWVLLLGDGLFGAAPGPATLWKQLLQRGRRGLVGDLTWRRPDAPRRPVLLPVALLEGLSGAAAQRRRRLLVATHAGSVWMLWAGCLLLELATLSGLLALLWLLLPEEAHWTPGMTLGVEDETFWWGAVLGAYVLASGLSEALSVAAGFGLYINGRTLVEGWDVELVFRRMARRLASGPVTQAAVMLLGALTFAAPALGQAEDPSVEEAAIEAESGPPGDLQSLPCDGADDGCELPVDVTRSALQPELRRAPPALVDEAAAARALERVRARPELQRTRFEERWVLRDDLFGESEDESGEGPPEWLLGLLSALASTIRGLLWVAVVLAVGGFVYLLVVTLERSSRGLRDRSAEARTAARVHIAGAPAREISALEAFRLARTLLSEGRRAEALSMLYVGMIAGFTVACDLSVPARATERQCLRLVESAEVDEGRKALFAELVERRLHVAYGHADIDAAQLEALCHRYAEAFEVKA